MNLKRAMALQVFLHQHDLMYHFDDAPRDCLGPHISDLTCMAIQHQVNVMMTSNIDWGLFDDAFGFAIALENGELDLWLDSFEESIADCWNGLGGLMS
jgi:hypothetical protein